MLPVKVCLLFNAAFVEVNPSSCSIDSTELLRLTIGKSIHGCQTNVEAFNGEINSQDVDTVSFEFKLPAGSATRRVPASDDVGAADVWEVRDVTLLAPAPAVHNSVRAIGAGHAFEGALGLFEAAIVGDYRHIMQ